MGAQFADGAFVGEQEAGTARHPSATSIATDFLTEDGKARGRPVGVTIDPREPLIVADNLSNTVWRIGVADQAAASN